MYVHIYADFWIRDLLSEDHSRDVVVPGKTKTQQIESQDVS